jgi:hypothetical protein
MGVEVTETTFFHEDRAQWGIFKKRYVLFYLWLTLYLEKMTRPPYFGNKQDK